MHFVATYSDTITENTTYAGIVKDNMDISARILSLRKNAGTTQAEVANQLGVSVSAYQNYEKGTRDIPASIVVKMCRYFEVSPRWLLLGEGVRDDDDHTILEASIISVRKFVTEQAAFISFQKEASLVVMIFEYMRNHEDAKPEVVVKFMEHALG